MTARTQQLLATALFASAVVTASVLVVPQLLAGQPVPTVADVPATPAADSVPVDVAIGTDASVDMNHWQETAQPKSPYVKGKPRKGK